MADAPGIYVMGDVHGQLAKLSRLLAGAGLIDAGALGTGRPVWAGGRATLWFLGDFVDRGPASVPVLDLVMRLEREAAAAGGFVGGLVGNHEVLLLAAHRFGDRPSLLGGTFRELWERNGAELADLGAITAGHIAWLRALPAMAHAGDALLVHADALFYEEYGDTVEAVNAAIGTILAGDHVDAWERLLALFHDRRAFVDSRPEGAAQAAVFLLEFGGRRLVHGHTPIATMTGQPPATVTGPLVYAEGLCVNCDAGMYRGGPGFLYRLPG